MGCNHHHVTATTLRDGKASGAPVRPAVQPVLRPCTLSPGRESGDSITLVDASDPDDVILVRGVVERPPQGAIVADGRHHQDSIRGDLQDLVEVLVKERCQVRRGLRCVEGKERY